MYTGENERYSGNKRVELEPLLIDKAFLVREMLTSDEHSRRTQKNSIAMRSTRSA